MTRWSKEKCARRYIEGDRISLPKLAQESGVPEDTLSVWCKAGDWVNTRRDYHTKLAAASQEKSIEKTSEKLSDELSDIAIANYEAHRLARDYAASMFAIKASHLKQIKEKSLEEQLEGMRSHVAYEMNFWSLVLSRATQGIESATGLAYYVNADASAKNLESLGYDIVEKQDKS